MRIAFLVHDFDRRRGQGRYVYELARRFARSHEVEILANTSAEASLAGVTIRHVPAWRASALTTVLSFALPATLKLRARYDIVHAQGFCGFRQDVVTAHICLAARIEALERRGPLDLRQTLWKKLVLPIERRTFQPSMSRAVIAVSRFLSRDLCARYRRCQGVEVIHHGVDTEHFSPASLEQQAQARRSLGLPDGCVALYVGELLKGAEAAIQVAAVVPGVHLAIVSGSPTSAMQALAQKLGVSTRVSFLPFTSDIAQAYHASDVLLFPTDYDAFGMVITEAMACGLSVVTSAAAGAAEVIDHGVSGFVLQASSSGEGFASAVRALVQDQALRKRVGLAARDRAVTLSWDGVAEQTMAVYRSVLEGERA